jgi:alcohol dehydrogenase (cytochrome c)
MSHRLLTAVLALAAAGALHAQDAAPVAAPLRLTVMLTDGRSLAGTVLGQRGEALQLRGDDRRIHLLRRSGDRYRTVTSQTDWASYHGRDDGNRHSALTQITPDNVSRLTERWRFTLPGARQLQVTPVVADGVMYVTAANEMYAVDAGTGDVVWHYQQPRTKGLLGVAAGGVNRGAAVAGDRVFMATDHAHVIALDRATGTRLWDTEMADWRQNYNATGAPLVVGSLVVAGVGGGDDGSRGFLAAFDQASGKEVWRFWTVPRPGERGSETWQGKAINNPGGATWMTGSYDPALDTLYWAVGNPGPDMIGEDRLGDNLYTDSVVALDPNTGRLKWHFQFTPHDVWDYDAQQPLTLIDTTWNGTPRKLLVQANRNGFFYVLDRTNGQFLLGRQYAKEVTWASGLTPQGRPIVVPDQEPSVEGRRVCPALEGASNWYSASYDAATGLFYVQTNDRCGIFQRQPSAEWVAGKSFMGGTWRGAPEPAKRVLRAIDPRDGRIVWELPQEGRVNSWGGVLSTASGLVFFCSDDGAFAAADSKTGKLLWSVPSMQLWKASPMTYVFDDQQHVAVANGGDIVAFALPM